MIQAGQVVLLPFPQTDQTIGKLRPAVVLRGLPGPHDDWLICMVSSQIHRHVADIDDIIRHSDADFPHSGLKTTSVIRVTRIAVLSGARLTGSIGHVSNDRLDRLRARLASWILGSAAPSAESAAQERSPDSAR